MNPAILIAFALGMRHGTDPDHLTAIDGLSRIRPRTSNGFLFALGHGLFVTLLAVGVGAAVAARISFLGPWVLIFIGLMNLRRVFGAAPVPVATKRPIIGEPFLLGMLLAAGFETASQFAALMLSNRISPWLVGGSFTAGMVIVDGLDGYLAASTQRLASTGDAAASSASRLLGVLVVLFSMGLGSAELAGIDIDRMALPLGIALFAAVLSIRLWIRAGRRKDPAGLTANFAPALATLQTT